MSQKLRSRVQPITLIVWPGSISVSTSIPTLSREKCASSTRSRLITQALTVEARSALQPLGNLHFHEEIMDSCALSELQQSNEVIYLIDVECDSRKSEHFAVNARIPGRR